MSAFATWLIKQITVWGIKICNVFIEFLQTTIDYTVDFALMLLTLWPNGTPASDPGAMPLSTITEKLITTLNWLFPISFFITTIAWLCAGMLAYVIIAPVARWFKLLS